uniref:DUF569 domain-containing protein n=1 Tax=Macrostomum lignano TaxID=282301 RepID=A0A1I8F7F0_9PLAT
RVLSLRVFLIPTRQIEKLLDTVETPQAVIASLDSAGKASKPPGVWDIGSQPERLGPCRCQPCPASRMSSPICVVRPRGSNTWWPASLIRPARMATYLVYDLGRVLRGLSAAAGGLRRVVHARAGRTARRAAAGTPNSRDSRRSLVTLTAGVFAHSGGADFVVHVWDHDQQTLKLRAGGHSADESQSHKRGRRRTVVYRQWERLIRVWKLKDGSQLLPGSPPTRHLSKGEFLSRDKRLRSGFTLRAGEQTGELIMLEDHPGRKVGETRSRGPIGRNRPIG